MKPDFSIRAWGYRTDLSDPVVKKLYFRYKRWKGIPEWCPLSDQERHEFDTYVMSHFARGKNSAKKDR